MSINFNFYQIKHQFYKQKSMDRLFTITILVLVVYLPSLQAMTVVKKQISPQFLINLVGTNDIHGAAYPTILSRQDTGERYQYGGLVYMAKLIQIIKEESNGNFLYLDAGDQFQGGLESSKIISSGQIISDYFNHMEVDAGAIGNHEFDFGPQFLDVYLSKLESDILSTNLIDSTNNQLPLRNQEASKIYTFPITDPSPFIDKGFKQIKIGVIGLSTIQTPTKTSGFIDGLFPQSYKFQQYVQHVQDQAEKLEKKGVHAVILLTHVGNACNDNSQYGIWTMKNQREIPCQKDDQMFALLDGLPDGLVDVVVQGHRHTHSHYFYKDVPIIGTTNGGYYLNKVQLVFTIQGNTAHLQPHFMSIQGPIPVCARIFQNTKKCEYISPAFLQDAGRLINWKFHGVQVVADSQLQQIYKEKYSEKMKKYQYEIADNYIPYPLLKDYQANSSLGNLITNVMANALLNATRSQFDFVLLNGGGFRTAWYPGVIRYAELHSMFPFDNDVIQFSMTGRDLKMALQILQNGQKKFYPSWGLSQTYTQSQDNKTLTLKSVKLSRNGEQLKDEQLYTGYTIGFLVNGGDDFSKVLAAGAEIVNQKLYPALMKQLIQSQLQKMGKIDETSLQSPGGLDRIIIEKYSQFEQIIQNK